MTDTTKNGPVQPEQPTAEESKKLNRYRVGDTCDEVAEAPDPKQLRKSIEPWLSAVFQSEHLALLLGNGFTTAIAHAAGAKPPSMDAGKFDGDLGKFVEQAAKVSAVKALRGNANIEDYLRTASELLRGLEILDMQTESAALRAQIIAKLTAFLKAVLATEASIRDAVAKQDAKAEECQDLLVSFLLSFASRSASRERLNLFTTNYDRLVECACDLAGLHVIDRFVGPLTPVFRAGRLNIDLHYNPPGIRGEPRYMEGVLRFFKLHGSLDWRQEGQYIRRYAIPFGTLMDEKTNPFDPVDSVIIYPRATKDMETAEYPYAELFRDFAAAICRPNSALVTYGYGFGDDHINRVIRDMLTIPSTHLVIISYDDPGGRIDNFCNSVGHKPQISLLIGNHLGNLPDLVANYLPKPAIDPLPIRRAELLRRREAAPDIDKKKGESDELTD